MLHVFFFDFHAECCFCHFESMYNFIFAMPNKQLMLQIFFFLLVVFFRIPVVLFVSP